MTPTRAARGIGQYSCPTCQRRLSTKSHLYRHINDIHLKERTFLCQVRDCNYETTQSGNLKLHMGTHKRKESRFSIETSGAPKGARPEACGSLERHQTILSASGDSMSPYGAVASPTPARSPPASEHLEFESCRAVDQLKDLGGLSSIFDSFPQADLAQHTAFTRMEMESPLPHHCAGSWPTSAEPQQAFIPDERYPFRYGMGYPPQEGHHPEWLQPSDIISDSGNQGSAESEFDLDGYLLTPLDSYLTEPRHSGATVPYVDLFPMLDALPSEASPYSCSFDDTTTLFHDLIDLDQWR